MRSTWPHAIAHAPQDYAPASERCAPIVHRHGGAGRLPPEEGAAADLLRARADELDSSPCQHPYAADSVWMPFVLHGAPLLAPQAAHDTAMPMPFG